MDFLIKLAVFLKDYLFDQPAIFIGLVALLGLMVQKDKKIDEVVSGTIKSIVGFLILSAGAGMIAEAVFPVADLLNHIMNIEVSASQAIGQEAFTNQWGTVITVIMMGSFFINLFIARFTKFKYVYLTVHQMFWMIFVYLAVAVEVLPDANITWLILVGSLLGGLYFTFQPAITQPFLRKVTKSDTDEFAYGHTTSFATIVGSISGNLFSKHKDNSSEDIKIPSKLSFLKDVTVSTAVIMVILYVIAVLVAGTEFVEVNISGGQKAIPYAISQGLAISVGITVLLMGVNMMVAEIVPAFKGISEKIVPNAVPALDCPIVFGFAPTAVMIGFLSCLTTVIVFVVIFGMTGFYALTPPVITTFFAGGPAGVFGNSTGGWRGAIIAGVMCGVMIAFGQYLTVNALSTTVADFARWSNDLDYAVFPKLFKIILEFVASVFGLK